MRRCLKKPALVSRMLLHAVKAPQTSLNRMGTTQHWTLPGNFNRQALCHLSSLRHLELQYCRDWDDDDSLDEAGADAVGFESELPYLASLTHLKVERSSLNIKAWHKHISALTALQELVLKNSDDLEYFDETVCPSEKLFDQLLGKKHLQGLTSLRLPGINVTIGARSRSTLGRLTGLQCLALQYRRCDLAVLSAITRLQSLSLCYQTPWECNEAMAAIGKKKLQTWLMQQTHLTHLSIGGQWPPFDEDWDLPLVGDGEEDMYGSPDDLPAEVPGAVAGMEVFASFTASSILQHLDLSRAKMQHNGFKHIFPHDRQLLQLTRLDLPGGLYDPRWEEFDQGLVLKGADVQAVAACFPALQDLRGPYVLYVRPELSALQQLTHLHAARGSPYPGLGREIMQTGNYWYFHRCFRNEPIDTTAADQALAALTNLKHLC